ncbi:MAG TPA: hypothetical protein DDW50_03190 [Firmicutes bacterium]|nr:hypothetical protein [Bacillota bacterium]
MRSLIIWQIDCLIFISFALFSENGIDPVMAWGAFVKDPLVAINLPRPENCFTKCFLPPRSICRDEIYKRYERYDKSEFLLAGIYQS